MARNAIYIARRQADVNALRDTSSWHAEAAMASCFTVAKIIVMVCSHRGEIVTCEKALYMRRRRV